MQTTDYQRKLDQALLPDGKDAFALDSAETPEKYQEALDNCAKPAEKTNDEVRETKIQAFKYLLCTASAGVIQFVSFTIMVFAFKGLNWGKINFITEMDMTLFVATTVALALSVIWNFTLNRKFTFKSAKNVPVAMALAFLFYVPFYPFQTWYVHSVAVSMGNGEGAKLLAEATVMLINGVLEFCWQKFFIYRNDTNTAVK